MSLSCLCFEKIYSVCQDKADLPKPPASLAMYLRKLFSENSVNAEWVCTLTEVSFPCETDTSGGDQLTAEASGMFSQGSNCHAVSREQPFLRELD